MSQDCEDGSVLPAAGSLASFVEQSSHSISAQHIVLVLSRVIDFPCGSQLAPLTTPLSRCYLCC